MVCLGNICRSPIAEGVLRSGIVSHRLPWQVESAGTADYHIGRAPHEFSQKICQTHQIDISGQRARRFDPEDFQRFDKIYAMDTDVLEHLTRQAPDADAVAKLALFLDESFPGAGRSVPDPWYGPEAGYAEVYALISLTCDKIIERYR